MYTLRENQSITRDKEEGNNNSNYYCPLDTPKPINNVKVQILIHNNSNSFKYHKSITFTAYTKLAVTSITNINTVARTRNK